LDEKVIKFIAEGLVKFEKERKFLHKEYSIDILATEIKTNIKSLSYIINTVKGVSFTHYVNTLKIAYIIDKLETDNKFLQYNIQGLSDISGFNNVLTFTRAFKQHTKMNPSEFINQLKNNKL
jgi:AraC-like DNA-binding protein